MLLIPGFLASDKSLAALGRWLSSGGWSVYESGLTNSGCGAVIADRMGSRLATVTATHGGPVTVIGHSRGGQIGHVLAVRYPHLVSEVVTLGSPLTDPFAMHTSLRLVAAACSLLTRAGVPGLVDRCPFGPCCQEFHDDLFTQSKRRLTCLFSKTDGIVDWRTCRHPDAENIQVRASHLGFANNWTVRQALARCLSFNVYTPAT